MQEQMQRASELIKQGRYGDARALLVTIDHPQAKEWIARIDQIAAARPALAPEPVYGTSLDSAAPPSEAPITAASVPLALVGGLVGGLIAGGIWAAIVKVTSYEISYAALGVGAIAGLGAVLLSRRRGIPIQLVAVLTALFGIAVGKYLSIYLVAVDEAAQMGMPNLFAGGLFDPTLVEMILSDPASLFSPYDLVWLILAVFAAWRVASATGTAAAATRRRQR